jgi:hypothetical protein
LNGRKKVGKRRNIWEKGKLFSHQNNAGIREMFRNISL